MAMAIAMAMATTSKISNPLMYNWSAPPINEKKPSLRMNRSFRLRTRSLSIETEVADTVESQSLVRRLILLRHAKSSWENPSLRDHDRPLSKAGRDDAIKVSQKLQQLGWIPQLILSSFYSVAAMDGQTAEHLQQAICKYSTDEIVTVMCMGHNRGWEEAASMFAGALIELKTCNAALLEASGKSWEEVRPFIFL
ncbi:uncharacterized protein At3g52155, chloroplastic-like isoform X2 [Pistacia vera]|uniref:uncharacterized protein At3g52155, chloroplastic-like isoform X2 n=1 Tax=Pistacia vera TaxID=55513 RepID=UPI001263BF72|nr:uncharacterized protein At3g52155, chloroplastic-like isoform X2 [Pistacia vera]